MCAMASARARNRAVSPSPNVSKLQHRLNVAKRKKRGTGGRRNTELIVPSEPFRDVGMDEGLDGALIKFTD